MDSNEILYEKLEGTNGYFAPEVLFKKNYDHRVDIWSLGCAFIKIYTNINPFFNMNSENTDYHFDYFFKFIKKYDDEFQKFIIQLININPDERISCKALLEKKWFHEEKKVESEKITHIIKTDHIFEPRRSQRIINKSRLINSLIVNNVQNTGNTSSTEIQNIKNEKSEPLKSKRIFRHKSDIVRGKKNIAIHNSLKEDIRKPNIDEEIPKSVFRRSNKIYNNSELNEIFKEVKNSNEIFNSKEENFEPRRSKRIANKSQLLCQLNENENKFNYEEKNNISDLFNSGFIDNKLSENLASIELENQIENKKKNKIISKLKNFLNFK
ncbi:unnamed protein product [Brachionus calyciflorus]|uniref:Protein kinase domain-containing protein n=1 Tax=Brachionus calyciflorus TaxID=104777 RepID=A0A813RHU0_9BILA|nr:unnamed protein product [Brachionus calyciflorus]